MNTRPAAADAPGGATGEAPPGGTRGAMRALVPGTPSNRLLRFGLLVIALFPTVIAFSKLVRVHMPGIDLEIPLRATQRWVDGGQPYLASSFQQGPGPDLPFLYPPFVLPFLAPLLALQRDLVLYAWVAVCLAAAVWGLRRLRVPWLAVPLILISPPFAEGIIGGNVQVPLFAAFAALFFARFSGAAAGGSGAAAGGGVAVAAAGGAAGGGGGAAGARGGAGRFSGAAAGGVSRAAAVAAAGAAAGAAVDGGRGTGADLADMHPIHRDPTDSTTPALREGVLATVLAALKVSQLHSWAYLLFKRPGAAMLGVAVVGAFVLATLPLTGIDVWLDWLAQVRRAADPSWSIGGVSIAKYLPQALAYGILVLTVVALWFVPRATAGTWVGTLAVVGAPSLHVFGMLFMVPAWLAIRRELALIAGFFIGTFTEPGVWIALVLVGLAWTLGATRWSWLLEPAPGAGPVIADGTPEPVAGHRAPVSSRISGGDAPPVSATTEQG